MPSSPVLIAFIIAALILLLTPGPGVLYVVTRSLTQGVRAGIISACGLATGVLAHIAAAVAGLSALLVASATAFTVTKIIGATYLIYLGVRQLFTAPTRGGPVAPARPSGRLFLDGIVVSLFNPKLALFFLAFLPQFVDPSRGNAAHQVIVLGLVYIGLALITDSGYAVAAGRLGRWLVGTEAQSRWPRYVSGTIYIGLGVTTALTGRRS
jgi:threonine/homoserine/homoserine lactone efflux protein